MLKRIVIEDSRETVKNLLVRLEFPRYTYRSASMLTCNELELALKKNVKISLIQLWSTSVTEAIKYLAECKKPGNWPAIFRSGVHDSKVSDGMGGIEEYKLSDSNEVISRVDTDMLWRPSQLPLCDLFKNDWWLPEFVKANANQIELRVCDLKFDYIDEEYCMDSTELSIANFLSGHYFDVEVS